MIPLPSDGSVSIAGRSPGLVAAAVEAVVTLPTFKRPEQLLATLASLKAQETGRRFAIIVIENEAEARAGARAALPLFEGGDIPGMVIVAHERGNCSAYNAGWQTAILHFPDFSHLLVIDDDEIADPQWLERMCHAAETLGADIVGGPQMPVFADAAHASWAEHPVFAPPYRQTGRVPALYSSGNLLVGRNVLTAMGPPFLDLKFNFMGGGDSDFLSRVAQTGFVLGWCAEAQVHETVPARRIEADWIRARSLRNGVISTLVEKKKRAGTPFAGTRVFLKSLALLAVSPFRGAARLARTRSLATALYPIHVAVGRVLAEFGYANEQYRQPEKN
ncbi:glycosyltransferase [Mesorhizobium sp.]|uniref:glycosyltransferase family 2 protein n=2 Tax=Mesorhizobium sp. TaxID=1871066 RepID=UPI000FE855FD|nr:glycosyltransferase [Mesorhizobium sp.]RWO51357.1 MAG: glycosyltransferase [Mesorhizobium sp.]TIN26603.1 MAG: glycosyltransferase family 2 protein [Mesorhizobium sp.]TIN36533.1 MAG: glycosyltransferase family 2 protein [Mesorhizobium sp.]TJU83147.1 MAG: glycosyltransferase family 2 protein [Mesorhizobium sp.]TJU87737.1 MAG: glycosyltransferase family 2 protein [Mesorhizobium sp.]